MMARILAGKSHPSQIAGLVSSEFDKSTLPQMAARLNGGEVLEGNSMFHKTSLLFAALVLAFPVFAEAKNLYVNANHSSCSDSTTYANNSSSSPWCTIGRATWGSTSRSSMNASQAAQAGDTVIVRPGTYTTIGTNRGNTVAYLTANSGTSNAPIVFQGEPGVILTYSSGAGPVIGASDRRNYIVWRGFNIDERLTVSHPDTGPVILWDTTGSIIEDTVIDGNGVGHGVQDNHCGIRIEWGIDVVVRNNRIHNVRTTPERTHVNGAGIMTYHSTNVLIENNEIYDSGSGIFVKGGSNNNFTIRYNLVHDNGHGIVMMFSLDQPENKVYQNIARNNVVNGIALRGGSNATSVVNNTIVSNANGINYNDCLDSRNNRVLNNIVSDITGSGGEINAAGYRCTAAVFPFIDRNVYFDDVPRYALNATVHTTLSAWKTALGGSAGDDLNSITSDSLFVDATNGNYRLQSGSPARTLGRDALNLTGQGTNALIPAGAYITGNEVIGRTNTTTPPPNTLGAPTGLRVISPQ